MKQKYNTLKYKLFNNLIFYFLMLQTALLLVFTVPKASYSMADNIIIFLFGISSICVVITYMFWWIKNKKKPLTVEIFILVFYAICFLSFLNGLLFNNVSISEYLRGLIPFCWLFYLFIFINRMPLGKFEKIITIFIYVSLLFSSYIIFLYIWHIIIGGNPADRVTFHYPYSTTPIALVGTIIALGKYVKTEGKWLLAVSLVNYIAIMLTQTKSLFVAVIPGIVLLLFVCRHYLDKKRIYLILGLYIFATLLIFTSTTASIRWTNMYAIVEINQGNQEIKPNNQAVKPNNQEVKPNNLTLKDKISKYKIVTKDAGSTSVRITEFKIAINESKQSLLFGRGLGYRYNAYNYNVEYGSQHIGYMHNIIAYTLMDFGVIGLIFLVVSFAGLLKLFIVTLKFPRKHNNLMMLTSLTAIFCLAIYANFFAVFRSIQAIYIFVMILGYFYVLNLDNERQNSFIYEK